MFPNIIFKLRMTLYILIKMLVLNIVVVSNANGKDIDPVAAARKALKPIKFENADPEMVKFKQWVLWRYELNDKGKLTKVPYSIGKKGKLYRASANKPQSWLSFKIAKTAYESGKYDVDGVGFVFTEHDQYCCADFDHVIDLTTGEVNKVALEEAIALNSRVERSPSGTGWHIIFYGKMPLPGKKKDLEDGTGREMYCDLRYMTMTFDVPPEFTSSINNSEVEGLKLFHKYWPNAEEPSKIDENHRSVYPTFDIEEISANNNDGPLKNLSPTKDQVLEYCRNAPNGFGEKFDRLFNGDISEYESDESDADMALAGMIAFHTPNYSIIKEIMQESALWDQKWEREDYCRGTISKAIANSRWGKVNMKTSATAIQPDIIESEETDMKEPVLPKGYEIIDSSLKMTKNDYKTGIMYNETICHSPIMLTGVSQDIDTGQISYEISFTDPLNHHHKEMYKQEELITSSNLKKTTLASKINLIDVKTNDLCQYFNESIKENALCLPRTITVSKYGWRKDGSFVVGNRMITNDGTIVVRPVDEDNSLISTGSCEGWIEAVRPVIGDNTVRFKCYCALSSMLLRLLNVQSFLVDHAGDSSQGKTFGFQVAVSMCGNPIELQLAANSSLTFMELKAAACNDLPLFFDETSLQSSEILTKLTYMIANEVGRGRATHATLQAVNRWKTVALVTGEITIVTTNLNGAAVRVVLIPKKMKTMPVGVIEKSLVGISNNYGHIIGLFMEKVLKNKDDLKLKFVGILKQFMNKDQSTMINRSASAYAAIATAGLILEDVFADIGIPVVDPVGLVREFFNEVNENPNDPYPIKALRYLYDYTKIHRNSFIINDNDLNLNREIYGYISEDYIDMYKPSTKDALKEGNFNISVIEDWIKDGIIIVNKGRHDFKITSKVDSSQHYVYRFDIAKVMEKLGN